MGVSGLGPEVLNDYLLNVAVSPVKPPNSQNRVDALLASLSNTYEDTRGKRQAQLAGDFNGAQPHSGALAGSVFVGCSRGM